MSARSTMLAARVCAAALACGAAALPLGAQTADSSRQSAAAADSTQRMSLDDALNAAELRSEDVAIAEAGVTRAHGQQVKARSGYLPQISGSLSYTRTLKSIFQGFGSADTTGGPASCGAFHPNSSLPLDQRVALLEQALGCAPSSGNLFNDFSSVGFGSANQYTLGLSLTQNLFSGGRVSAQVRQAGAQRETAEIGLTAARAQLILQVTQAYYDAALSDRLLEIAVATLAQADTTLAQTRLAKNVGNQPEFDLLRAQVTRDNQVPVVIQRRSSRDLAYLRLKQALDLPLDQQVVLTTSLGDTGVAASSRLAALIAAPPDTAASGRAPVREAEQAVTADRAALTVAHAQRIPTLTLSSQFGRSAFPNSGFPDWSQFHSNWTITGGIQVPLFTGGSIHGDELVAEANLRESQARQRQTRQLAALDTHDAVSQLQAAESQFTASEGTVEQAVKAYQIAEVRYREGISPQTELSDSRISLQQAQANRAQAARDLQVARVRVALLHDLPISTAPAAGAPNAPNTTQQPQTLTVPPVITVTPASPVPGVQTSGAINPSGVTP
jgi:outer membrane protein TolC